MKYRITHFYPTWTTRIPGVYEEGEPYNGVTPCWIDIPDDQFAAWIKQLATEYDVLLLGPYDGADYHRIWVDSKGKRFHQR